MSRILIWHDHRMKNTDISKQFLKEHFPNEKIVVTNNREEVLDNITDTEILVSVAYDKEMIDKGTNIKWIQTLGAGYNQFDIGYLKNKNIKVSRVVGAHNIHLAEFAIMSMVMLVREMNVMFKSQQEHIWLRDIDQDRIYKKTLVLVGCGAIGMTIAKYAKNMGMHVIGIKRTVCCSNYLDECYTTEKIETILPMADMVLTILPSSPQTYHFMTYERFKLMKPSAFFINLGRGDVVSSDVIYDVLSNNIIKGAFLDVFEIEPLSSDSLLWDLKNLIITSHSSGYYKHYLAETFKCFYKNYSLYKEGKELFSRIDNLY